MTTDAVDQPDPAAAPEPPATDAPDLGDEKDWKAEYEKLQRNSRKWEDRAKTNANAAKELDELRKQHESDQDRAVREATDRVRAEVLAEIGAERVADAFRVAAAGRVLDVDEMLDGINTARFLDDDGQPDRDAVQQFVDRIAPAKDDSAPSLDLGQGARGTQPPGLNSSQLERDLMAKLGVG